MAILAEPSSRSFVPHFLQATQQGFFLGFKVRTGRPTRTSILRCLSAFAEMVMGRVCMKICSGLRFGAIGSVVPELECSLVFAASFLINEVETDFPHVRPRALINPFTLISIFAGAARKDHRKRNDVKSIRHYVQDILEAFRAFRFLRAYWHPFCTYKPRITGTFIFLGCRQGENGGDLVLLTEYQLSRVRALNVP